MCCARPVAGSQTTPTRDRLGTIVLRNSMNHFPIRSGRSRNTPVILPPREERDELREQVPIQLVDLTPLRPRRPAPLPNSGVPFLGPRHRDVSCYSRTPPAVRRLTWTVGAVTFPLTRAELVSSERRAGHPSSLRKELFS